MPDTYTVAREVHVAAPPEALLELLVDFRRWRDWSPFEELDPGMRRSYEGSGVGSSYDWAGSMKAGTGRMELVEVDAHRVVVEQHNHKPFRSRSTSTFTVVPVDGGSRVTWSGSGTPTRVMRVVGRVVPMEKVLGPVFEKGWPVWPPRPTVDAPSSSPVDGADCVTVTHSARPGGCRRGSGCTAGGGRSTGRWWQFRQRDGIDAGEGDGGDRVGTALRTAVCGRGGADGAVRTARYGRRGADGVVRRAGVDAAWALIGRARRGR